MKKYNLSFIFVFMAISIGLEAVAQPKRKQTKPVHLAAGPMLGAVDMKQIVIWLQTKGPESIQIKYWQSANPKNTWLSEPIQTSKNTEFTAHVTLGTLEPGTSYNYMPILSGKKLQDSAYGFKTQTLWQWRTDPPPFTLAIGSCAYINEPTNDRPGKGYGDSYQIFEKIAAAKPDLMLWLGDNNYLRETDWNTREGIFYRNSHTRATPQLQNLLATCPHYAIWDDHDYGPNDADRGFWNKNITFEAFKTFWANPNYNLTGQGGITGTFFHNDIQFFLLDDRWFKSPNNDKTPEAVLFGKAQIDWLIDALNFSQSPFKIIASGGQFLHNGKAGEIFENYPQEKQRLLDLLEKHKIEGVVFLSGDRHHAELSKMNRPNAYPLYDFTCSPLTAGSHEFRDEKNTYLLTNTLYLGQNFGLLDFSGDRKNRQMIIRLMNAEGKQVWEQKINAQDLKYK